MSKTEFSIGRRAFLGLGLPTILLACKEQSSPTTPSNPAKGAENVDIIDHEQKQSLEFLSYWVNQDMLRHGVVYDRNKSGFWHDTRPESSMGLTTGIAGSMGSNEEIEVRFYKIYDKSGVNTSSSVILFFGRSKELIKKSQDFSQRTNAGYKKLWDVAGADRIARSVFKHIPEGSGWQEREVEVYPLPGAPVSMLETQFSVGELQINVAVRSTYNIVLTQTVK